jgi:hypothetical protein
MRIDFSFQVCLNGYIICYSAGVYKWKQTEMSIWNEIKKKETSLLIEDNEYSLNKTI